jgi:hypothetical protein
MCVRLLTPALYSTLQHFTALYFFKCVVIGGLLCSQINEKVLAILTSDQLKELGIAAYGTRAALLAYAKRAESNEEQACVERVRAKLCEKKSSLKAKLAGNKNAVKKMKKIEIGWLNYCPETQQYKQVKRRTGGGTRTISVSLLSTVGEVLEVHAQTLFFPGGNSQLGPLEKFTTTAAHFDQTPIKKEETIGQLYEKTGFSILRLYMCTREKEKEAMGQINSSNNEAATDESPSTTNDTQQTATGEVKRIKLVQSMDNVTQGNVSLTNDNTGTMDFEQFQHLITFESGFDTSILGDPRNYASADDEVVFSVKDDNEQSLSDTIETQKFEIEIHRGHVLEELETYFMENDIVSIHGMMVHVTMILPNGEKEVAEDNGGVLRDMLSEYWSSFYDRRCEGNTIKVPHISPKMNGKQWTAVSNIIAMGYYSEKHLPNQLSPSFLQFAMSGKDIEKTELLDEYIKFLSDTEAQLVKNALEDFNSVEMDDLLGFLDDHEHSALPTEDNLKNLICEVAHKELLQAPAYIAEAWRSKLQMISPLLEKPISDISEMTPTFKKVWDSLSFQEPGTPKSLKTMLKKYIKELDTKSLSKFLRFCTGKLT